MNNCVEDNCEEKLDAACVIYKFNEPQLSNIKAFIGLDGNVSVEKIFEVLDAKLALITFDGAIFDEKVKVNAEDGQTGYLEDKVIVDEPLTLEITDDFKLLLGVDNNKLLENLLNETISLYASTNECPQSCENCTPEPTVPVISASNTSLQPNESASLTSTNCNGTVYWYRNSTYAGIGPSLNVGAGTYFAKCNTACDISANSNSLVITSNTIIYTATRTGMFKRNNCANNQCGEPSSGSDVAFNKTYTSRVNQAAADLAAANDTAGFNIEGQANANTKGTCTSVTTVIPSYCSIELNHPTCIANIAQSNGSIYINGILNGNRIAYNTSGFETLDWQSATPLNASSYNLSSLAANTYYIRIFYAPLCYLNVLQTLNSPSCQDVQISVTQAVCADNPQTTENETFAKVVMTNLTGFVSYIYCLGPDFTCVNNCNSGNSPSITANSATITLPPPLTSSQVYTIRLYRDNTCNNYVQRQVSISKPDCCNVTINTLNTTC
jgi:hypothetical protein